LETKVPAIVVNPLIEVARAVSRNSLARWAAKVDGENRFPEESVEALRGGGFLGFFVPARFGGPGGNLVTYCEIASVLAEECLSTALIWAMHTQQVAILAEHAAESHGDVLAEVARRGTLVASVTTEKRRGSSLLAVESPLIREGCLLRLRRFGPVVSYGREAGYFLVTMRASEDRPDNDVRLVLVSREDGTILTTGEWNAMGMRGTRSVPMKFDVVVGKESVIGACFRAIALQTMVPIAHLGWAAAWFGAARGAFRRILDASIASDHAKRRLTSDLFISRIANIRISLDLMSALLWQTVERFERMRLAGAALDEYEDLTYNIALNNVKIASARLSFAIADELIELSGLAHGYLKDSELGLERVFRDLRAASLMYNNDQLLDVNGKLIAMEHRFTR
jgi:acyl-CoA dehydrogenase